MIVAAALLLGGLAGAWMMPRALWRMTWRIDPTTAIVAWVMAIVGVLGTVAAGVVLLFLPGHGQAESVIALVHGCWSAVLHGSKPTLDEAAAGVVGALGIVAGAVRFGVVATRHLAAQRRAHRRHLEALRGVARRAPGRIPVLWLPYHAPLAYSVGGRPGLVIATDGLTELPTEQLNAVLAHEYAHLRGRHHLLITIAEALAKALPLLAVVRQAPVALRLLVELAADAAAARRYGQQAVCGALLAVAGNEVPVSALGMVSEMIDMRLDFLASAETRTRRLHRMAMHSSAGLLAVASPAFAGITTLALVISVVCPGA
jgi:Zn-dependent protease with chaperone function